MQKKDADKALYNHFSKVHIETRLFIDRQLAAMLRVQWQKLQRTLKKEI